MAISTFDLFSVGIGPSSSHTVGPMRAARRFAEGLRREGKLEAAAKVRVELYGSLGATGRGHGTDKAVLLGLLGETPEDVDVDGIPAVLQRLQETRRLALLGVREVICDPRRDLLFHKRRVLPGHPNGMLFRAEDAAGEPVHEREYYSVGGGFVVDPRAIGEDRIVPDVTALPHPFASGAELLERCREAGLRIATLMRRNERVWRSDAEIDDGLDRLWAVMQACIERGCRQEGILPGGLKVRRRAPSMLTKLRRDAQMDPLAAMDWVNLYALAVNEENAAGGRVVTAPTNGAAGIIPAVMKYWAKYGRDVEPSCFRRFLLTAAAVGTIFKERASISGAEVGCQGEVGVACSMAAAGLAEVMGGTPAQCLNAAEIGMEHNLGLTCDPVGGLVQVPCIERNAMGSVKAINAARLALRGDGTHKVSLDQVIETMRQTGLDMKTKYKETARGGLAVNIIEC